MSGREKEAPEAASCARKAALVCIVAAFAAFASGCARRDARAEHPREGDAGAVIDTDVLAFLSAARAIHHQANIEEDQDRIASAADALTALFALPRPRRSTPVPEVEEVLADASARLADLLVRLGKLEAAERAVSEGLEHAEAPTYFRGHLLEVSGTVDEARALAFADAGLAAAADESRRRAMERLRQAVDLQKRVIDEATGDASPP